ncbi:hypothetical protein Ciccas_002881 [Cichlidogyrus casuarinus]|uniref:Transmembrane protein n=1 Tax=Cichlidogyrus casuarinus TaxID=1844966 RepID=A0ABD2QFY7_9PLAT
MGAMLTQDGAHLVILALAVGCIIASLCLKWPCGNLWKDCANNQTQKGKLYLTTFALLVTAAVGLTFAFIRDIIIMNRSSLDGRGCSGLRWFLMVLGSVCGVAAIVIYISNEERQWPILLATGSVTILLVLTLRMLLSGRCE